MTQIKNFAHNFFLCVSAPLREINFLFSMSHGIHLSIMLVRRDGRYMETIKIYKINLYRSDKVVIFE